MGRILSPEAADELGDGRVHLISPADIGGMSSPFNQDQFGGQVDGSHGVKVVGVSGRDDQRLDFVPTLRVELGGPRKTSQRAKTVLTGAPGDPPARVARRDLIERSADQIDLPRRPRACRCDGAEFRALLAGAG